MTDTGVTECPPAPTVTPTPSPTATQVPTTFYATLITCDDPAGAILGVSDNAVIPTSMVVYDGTECYRWLNANQRIPSTDIDDSSTDLLFFFFIFKFHFSRAFFCAFFCSLEIFFFLVGADG